MGRYGEALDHEFLTAVKVLDLQKGEVLLNIPAGGVPIHKYIDPTLGVECLRFETSEAFAESDGIPFCEYTDIPLADATVDKILVLASLHHVVADDRPAVYKELARVLKPGGMLVIGDVIRGSAQDAWLNGFVDAHNSAGHQGLFFTESDADLLEDVGGVDVSVSRHRYRWDLKGAEDAIDFTRNLFGLDMLPGNGEGDRMLLEAMQSILGFDGSGFPWELIYFECKKEKERADGSNP